jgi:hypothetical protein
MVLSPPGQALLRKGLPPEYRPEVWWSILGCEAVKLRSPVSYQQYLEETVDAATSATIECDLPRTFPNHKQLRSRKTGGSQWVANEVPQVPFLAVIFRGFELGARMKPCEMRRCLTCSPYFSMKYL